MTKDYVQCFNEVTIEADGNCFYNSVIKQLSGEHTVESLRKTATKHIKILKNKRNFI